VTQPILIKLWYYSVSQYAKKSITVIYYIDSTAIWSNIEKGCPETLRHPSIYPVNAEIHSKFHGDCTFRSALNSHGDMHCPLDISLRLKTVQSIQVPGLLLTVLVSIVRSVTKKNRETLAWECIVLWHLLGHAIKSFTCFDLQFSRSTRPMTSFCIFIAYINTEGILLNFKITRWD
jgi:hypothetical protein